MLGLLKYISCFLTPHPLYVCYILKERNFKIIFRFSTRFQLFAFTMVVMVSQDAHGHVTQAWSASVSSYLEQ